MRRVSRLEARSLTLQVVEVLVPETNEVLLAELSIEVVECSPFRGETSQFVRPVAVSSACVRQQQRCGARIAEASYNAPTNTHAPRNLWFHKATKEGVWSL